MKARKPILVVAGLVAGLLLFLTPALATVSGDGPPAITDITARNIAQLPELVDVTAGENLSTIARTAGVSWWAIASYNQLADANVITPGQWLAIPPSGFTPPAMPAPTPAVLTANHNPAPAPAPRAVSGPSGWPSSCYGITDPDALWIIARESGCNVYAHNPSGACGIGQRMGQCGGYNGQAQAADMTSYVHARYGSFANARAFWESHGYY